MMALHEAHAQGFSSCFMRQPIQVSSRRSEMTTYGQNVSDLGELSECTLRRVKRRIMPLIVLLYFIAYLDRKNVGFAKLTMSEDIVLSEADYGLGAGIFFLGYALLEIP